MFEESIKGFSGEYDFLSNFYPVDIEYEGLIYPTSEHAYQAAKTNDIDSKIKIQKCYSAGSVKKMGRFVEIRDDWEAVKIDVMREILRLKFSNLRLKQMLLDTGDKYIEETNTWGDRFWGVCNGTGKNVLGNLLMQIRGELNDILPIS